jgi:hypothetical protein
MSKGCFKWRTYMHFWPHLAMFKWENNILNKSCKEQWNTYDQYIFSVILRPTIREVSKSSYIKNEPCLGDHTPENLCWFYTSLVLGSFSLGSKAAGHESDHSPPRIADVKKAWMHTSAPTYVFMA